MKKTKRTYHPGIILLYQLGMLPEHIKKQIPSSTLSDHKQYDLTKIFGMEYIDFIKRTLNMFQFMFNAYQTIEKLKHSLHVKNRRIKMLLKNTKDNSIETINKILQTVKYSQPVLGLKKTLKLLGKNIHFFRKIKRKAESFCKESVISKCFRRHPNQLTHDEIKIIKDLHENEEFYHWASINLYHYAKRKNLLHVSKSTWYNYAKKLNLIKKRAKNRRKKYSPGIKATNPNKVWQADVTIFKLNDGTKVYLYFIIDNYSRFILNWKVSFKLSAEIRKQTIEEAYHEHITHNNTSLEKDIDLIVDGGSENNNHTVNDFLKKPDVKIQKLIALKDIDFSNSLIEAFNKTLKYFWLYKIPIKDFNDLINKMPSIINNYNYKRYNDTIGGLTPHEAYSGFELDKQKLFENYYKSRKERIVFNQNYMCRTHNQK